MKKLENKVIILTGCSAGIGKQVAIKYAEEGAKLTICARREGRLMETKRLCEEAGGEVLAMACDIKKEADIARLVEETIQRYGKIDALVNNATQGTQGQPIMETSLEEMRSIFETNYFASWHFMTKCYPHMKANGGGSILNICSGAGVLGMAGFSPYAASKEAIRGLSRVAAHEWGRDNIRVNVLCPGAMTDTIQEVGFADTFRAMAANNTIPRAGDPYADIAPAYVFLVSDDAQYITGQTLNVDGGSCIVP